MSDPIIAQPLIVYHFTISFELNFKSTYQITHMDDPWAVGYSQVKSNPITNIYIP